MPSAISDFFIAVVGNIVVFIGSIFGGPSHFPQQDLNNIIYMDVPAGRVTIQMLPEVAPLHVQRIKQLVREHYYDGSPWHRVIPYFIAQTGDHTGTGLGGTGINIPPEFSDIPFVRGTVAMARGPWEGSADSQFFILLKDATYLNGKYTVWGKVLTGMEFVDKIKKGDAKEGKVKDPDVIINMRIAADVK